MPKLEKVKLGISVICDTPYIGTISKDKKRFLTKRNVEHEFLAVSAIYFKPGTETALRDKDGNIDMIISSRKPTAKDIENFKKEVKECNAKRK
jgi:hypothetical protein